ncbi:ABC transporter substrate-binding protein, partial [Burkholderia diffusa]
MTDQHEQNDTLSSHPADAPDSPALSRRAWLVTAGKALAGGAAALAAPAI